jgi:hypothetical protein
MSESNNNQNTYTFHQDNEFEITVNSSWQVQFSLHEEQREVFALCPMTIYMTGQWELRDDTLTFDYNTSETEMLSCEIDLSSLPQSALTRLDSLDVKLEAVKGYFLETFRQQSRNEVYVVSFDKMGNSMLWNNVGDKDKTSYQLYRKL